MKLVLTRAPMFPSNGDRPRTIQKLKFAANTTGKLVSMRHDGLSQMSQPALGKFSEPVALATEILYACPNVAISHRVVPVKAALPTYMRAPATGPALSRWNQQSPCIVRTAKLQRCV